MGLTLAVVGASWMAYAILGLGQVGLAVVMILSILLIGGVAALVSSPKKGEAA